MAEDSDGNWWEKLGGPEQDLRNLLWEIARALGQTSPLGYLSWKDNERPFENIFRKNKKKTYLR